MSDSFFYYVRDWLLAEPDLATLMGYSPTDTFKPFFPAQEYPQTEIPYVRYNLTHQVDNDATWMHRGDVVLALWFETIDKSQQAANIIVDMCSHSDESAGELERWLRINDIDCPYHYHSIETPLIGEIETTGERGGAHAFGVQLTIRFSPKHRRDSYAYATG